MPYITRMSVADDMLKSLAKCGWSVERLCSGADHSPQSVAQLHPSPEIERFEQFNRRMAELQRVLAAGSVLSTFLDEMKHPDATREEKFRAAVSIVNLLASQDRAAIAAHRAEAARSRTRAVELRCAALDLDALPALRTSVSPGATAAATSSPAPRGQAHANSSPRASAGIPGPEGAQETGSSKAAISPAPGNHKHSNTPPPAGAGVPSPEEAQEARSSATTLSSGPGCKAQSNSPPQSGGKSIAVGVSPRNRAQEYAEPQRGDSADSTTRVGPSRPLSSNNPLARSHQIARPAASLRALAGASP